MEEPFRVPGPPTSPINTLQRAFSIGINDTGYGSTSAVCPTTNNLSAVKLRGLVFSATVNKSNLYVAEPAAHPEEEAETGGAKFGNVQLAGIYQGCSDPPALTDCILLSSEGELNILNLDEPIQIPEPDVAVGALACALTLAALRRSPKQTR